MKTFIILSMGRSATSLVAEGLAKSGVSMGKNINRPDKINRKGYYEDKDFIKLNKQILLEAGGTWYDPPSEEKIKKVGEKNAKYYRGFIYAKQQRGGSLWGWKDPRTALTIRCYIQYVIDPIFIICYRNPDEVAKSLYRRNGMPIEKGRKLTEIYNERIQNFIKDYHSNLYKEKFVSYKEISE